MDRNLREPDRALVQRLDRLEARYRALSLRAWQGAVRTSDPIKLFYPTSYTAFSPVASVTVPAGRWEVFGQASINYTAISGSPEQFLMSPFAYDAATGEFLGTDVFDNPSAFLAFPPVTVVPCVGTMNTMGDLKATESTLVILAVANTGGTPFVVSEPRLRLLPV